jgi:hypothetical protein
MKHVTRFFVFVATVCLASVFAAAQTRVTPDLKGIPVQKGWKLSNRAAQIIDKTGIPSAQFDSRQGDGLAWLDGFSFKDGVIECDILGRSRPVQGSFVGIAFRVANADTFDAVYFRPFNFRSDDPERRAHSVQYVSHPAWTWPRLRQERTGQYEKPIDPAPDGDGWFHVCIVVERPKVRVYVNGAKEPSLAVEELGDESGGSVGLFLGNGSPGTFSNLTVSTSLKHDE